jgi:NAD dependent epimerase/dehydratase family enzyme
LSSQRVVPQKLPERGFRFQYADLEAALRRALGA